MYGFPRKVALLGYTWVIAEDAPIGAPAAIGTLVAFRGTAATPNEPASGDPSVLADCWSKTQTPP